MAVTIQTPVQVGPNTWRLFWTSSLSTPTYQIFGDGQYVATTTGEHRDFPLNVVDGESALVEILDSATVPATTAMGARATISWDDVATAARYRVEQFVGAAWVVVKELIADQTRYHFITPTLAGTATAHQFRVTAIGVNGNEATAATINILSTRHPDPPTVAYAYSDATKKVTLTAA